MDKLLNKPMSLIPSYEYPSESWGNRLAQTFNRTTESEYAEPVLDLVKAMQSIESMAVRLTSNPEHRDEYFAPPLPKTLDPSLAAEYQDYFRLLYFVNKEVGKYVVTRYFPSGAGPFGWNNLWKHPQPSKEVSPSKSWQCEAVDVVLELARRGDLSKLRQCSMCERWFYANAKHQSFCTANCRVRRFAKSPEVKQKRRRYMARYRQQLRLRAVKARSRRRRK